MTAVYVIAPELTGEVGLTLFLRVISDGTLTNTGGDSLTESPAGSGRFEADVSEAITMDHFATVEDGAGVVRYGFLSSGRSTVEDVPVQEIKGAGFDPAEDDLHSLKVAVNAIDVGAGNGPNLVTLTITDGTNPLQNVSCRLAEVGGGGSVSDSTNVSGVAQLSVPAGDWNVILYKARYQFTPVVLTVNGDESETYAMTQTVITPPTLPNTATGALTDETGLSGITYHMQRKTGDGIDGTGLKAEAEAFTSQAGGLVEFTNMAHGHTYVVWRKDARDEAIETTVPVAATYSIPQVIG